METESSTAQTWHRRQYNLFPEKDRGSTYERRKNMKLNIKKFMITEMGGELEETIKAWDQALEERRKATPGIGDPDQGLGFGYWDRTCKSCQDRWEVFKLAIRQFYGIEFNFTRTDEYFGICNDDAGNLMIQELAEYGRQNTRGEEGERLERKIVCKKCRIKERIRTCSLQRKIGNAGRDSDGTCMGFASVVSDEPMERCKRCIACTSYQWEE